MRAVDSSDDVHRINIVSFYFHGIHDQIIKLDINAVFIHHNQR